MLLDAPDGRSSGYAFRHSLIAEVAYDGLLIGERVRLHSAFARELQRRGRIAGVEVTSAELAHHWVAARDAAHAIPTLIDAGREAGRMRQDGAMWLLWPSGRTPSAPR